MDQEIDELYPILSEAIRRAELLEQDGLAAHEAFHEVSMLEERIARLLPAVDDEGMIARRGAVRAAIKAQRYRRATILHDKYLAETAPDPLLHRQLEEIYASVAEPSPQHLSAVETGIIHGLVMLSFRTRDGIGYEDLATALAERISLFRGQNQQALSRILNKAISSLNISAIGTLLTALVECPDIDLQSAADAMVSFSGSPLRLVATDDDYLLSYGGKRFKLDIFANGATERTKRLWIEFCVRNSGESQDADTARSALMQAVG